MFRPAHTNTWPPEQGPKACPLIRDIDARCKLGHTGGPVPMIRPSIAPYSRHVRGVSKTSRPLYYIYSGYHPITAKQACPDQCLRTDCRRSRGLLCTVNRTIISSDRGLCLYKEQELAERSGRRLRRWRSKYGRARFRNGPSSTALNKVIPAGSDLMRTNTAL